jgi:hypothetical protein
MAIVAQVAKNDLMSRYVRNLWRGNFSKVIAFFKVKNSSVLLQQGDLKGNVFVLLCFDKFDNSILSVHFVAGVKISILSFVKMFASGT